MSHRLRIISVLLLGTLACGAHAHHRDFAFIRDWFLPYKGEFEVESRSLWMPSENSFDQEFEFEYGISDSFAVEPGFAFHKDNGGKAHLDAWGAELRFNFGKYQPNKWLYAANVEFEHPVDTAEPERAELRNIFSYYTPKGEDWTVNINVGQQLKGAKEKESEVQLGYVRNFGEVQEDNYKKSKGIRAGFESSYSLQDHNLLVGPVVAKRVSNNLNALGTLLLGVNNKHSNPTQFKVIFEWEF